MLPALRPLRLLRLVVLFRVLNRRAAATLRGRVPLYVTISAATLVVCAAIAVLTAQLAELTVEVRALRAERDRASAR